MRQTANYLCALIVGFVTIYLSISHSGHAQGTSSNMQDLALSNDQPIEIESVQMELNEADGRATFSGDVRVLQGDTTISAQKMVVYFADGASLSEGASEFDKIDLYGAVKLSSADQSATADKGSIDLISQIIKLSGDEVVLSEGESVFVGCQLTVNMRTGDARLESCGDTIKLLINPRSTQ